MIAWALIEDGKVVAAGIARAMPDGAVELPEGIAIEDAHCWYRPEADWLARPTLPVPEILGGVVTVTDCPAGTVAQVVDLSGDEAMGVVPETAGVIAITLADPGLYQVELTAPFPTLPRSIRLEVP